MILWYWYMLVSFLHVKFVSANFSNTMYFLLEVHKQPLPIHSTPSMNLHLCSTMYPLLEVIALYIRDSG